MSKTARAGMLLGVCATMAAAGAEPARQSGLVAVELGDEALVIVDFDLDGDEDVISAAWMDRGPRLRILLNDRGLPRPVRGRVSRQPAVANGGSAADYDGDGFVDLVVTGATSGASQLYRNDGGRALVLSQQLPTSCERECDHFLSSASFVDLDRDGRLEIFIGDVRGPALVYRLGGDGRYRLVQDHSLAAATNVAHHMFGDLDNDGRLELVIASNGLLAPDAPRPGVRIFSQDRGSFREVGSPTLSRAADSAEGVLLLDVDNDGLLDIFVSTFRRGARNSLFLNQGNLRFAEARDGFGHEGGGESAVHPAAADMDGDGWIDLFVTSFVGPDLLLRNRAGNGFERIPIPGGETGQSVIAAWLGDQEEGRPALLVARRDPSRDEIHGELTPVTGNWLRVLLEGRSPNRSAVGARVQIESAGMTQVRERFANGYGGRAAAILFGIGEADRVRRVRVRWGSGEEDCLSDVRTDQPVLIRQGTTTGCRRAPAAR